MFTLGMVRGKWIFAGMIVVCAGFVVDLMDLRWPFLWLRQHILPNKTRGVCVWLSVGSALRVDMIPYPACLYVLRHAVYVKSGNVSTRVSHCQVLAVGMRYQAIYSPDQELGSVASPLPQRDVSMWLISNT